MTMFRCPSDILIMSPRLFTARWSMWHRNHLVPCVAELVGSYILIHANWCLPGPKCHFYLSALSLCLSVDCLCLVPVDDMVLFHDMVCDGWLVSYTALPRPGGCVPVVKESCAPWSSDQTSCLPPQCMSWSSSCKAHNTWIRSSPDRWPTVVFLTVDG